MSLITAWEIQDFDTMLLIKQAELDAYQENVHVSDVRCRNGLITEIGSHLLPQKNEVVIYANGTALIPGLHDHHIHLLALAAEISSVYCGPPEINNVTELQQSLQQALKQSNTRHWIRGIQYHESVAGDLDRWQLDKWVNDRPLRIQHRSGILWILNSCAIKLLQIENEYQDGLERNHKGELTGRLFRLDRWLREKINSQEIPDLSAMSMQLSRFGITGITDAGADNDANTLALFEKSLTQGNLRQRVVLMGNQSLPVSTHPMITRGALKILLDEFQLPDWEKLKKSIQASHLQQRPVAFHCVTEAQLVFALSALEEAGYFPGDRIEHASLCSDEIMPMLKNIGVAIATQPGLISSRGVQYQNEISSSQHNSLYRCQSFLQQGNTLALSSDAPYGPVNPWRNMQAAINRCNSAGYVFGEAEKLTPEQALMAYLRDPVDLSHFRSITVGSSADLCLLKESWSKSRKFMDNEPVQQTFCAGRQVYSL